MKNIKKLIFTFLFTSVSLTSLGAFAQDVPPMPIYANQQAKDAAIKKTTDTAKKKNEKKTDIKKKFSSKKIKEVDAGASYGYPSAASLAK